MKLVDQPYENVNERIMQNMTYNMRYEIFTKTMHILTHMVYKNHKYFYKCEHDMISNPIYL